MHFHNEKQKHGPEIFHHKHRRFTLEKKDKIEEAYTKY